MIEIDISSGKISGTNEIIKILMQNSSRRSNQIGSIIEIKSGKITDVAMSPKQPNITPGVYMVPNGRAYGALYVECGENLLRERDTIPEYILAQIDSGSISMAEIRNSRTTPILLSEPCIFLNSTSHWVYGHWLLDIWPRAWVAKHTLGAAFSNYHILVPEDAPKSLLAVLVRILDINEEKIVYFNPESNVINAPMICVPSLLHNGYCPNPEFHGFLEAIRSAYCAEVCASSRKVFVSRSKFRSSSRSVQRRIDNEYEIEAAFRSSGYEIVSPETISFKEQISIFSQCSIIAGEAGSALHNSIFARPGAIVVSLSSINDVQPKLAEFNGHSLVTIIPDEVLSAEGTQLQRFHMKSINAVIGLADRLKGQAV